MLVSPQASVPESTLPASSHRRGFTLVELLVAMTVLLVLIVAMVGLTNQTNTLWRTSRERSTAFQGARFAFERITTNLSQATLNTYLDYYDATGKSRRDVANAALKSDPSGVSEGSALALFSPKTYDRASELQYVCGQSSNLIPGTSNVPRPTQALFFQCPLGHVTPPATGATASSDFKNLTRVLNAVGYYIEFNNENDSTLHAVPSFITPAPASWRYRLMELNQPSQSLGLYYSSVIYSGGGSWFSLAVDPVTPSGSPPGTTPPPAPVYNLADNVVALVVRPKAANPTTANPTVAEIAPKYAYDTKAYTYSSATSTDLDVPDSKNQLPPLVQITLVSIDATSALRLANQNGSTAPALVASGLFTDVANYTADLKSLTDKLQGQRLNYRVFVTDVNVPGAKWSQTSK